MASDTQIVNLALLRIGVSKRIANLDTETSIEAEAARVVYADERDYVLRDFPWPWATAYATLGLVSGSASTPYNDDWVYAYRYPSDCLFARRIVTNLGRSETNPAPFRIARDSQGRLILSNYQNAKLEYTSRVTDPQEFDALFVSMLAWKLSAALAPSLSRMANIVITAIQMYEVEKTKAQSRAANEAQATEPLEAEWIRTREGTSSGQGEDSTTIYPSGYTVT